LTSSCRTFFAKNSTSHAFGLAGGLPDVFGLARGITILIAVSQKVAKSLVLPYSEGRGI